MEDCSISNMLTLFLFSSHGPSAWSYTPGNVFYVPHGPYVDGITFCVPQVHRIYFPAPAARLLPVEDQFNFVGISVEIQLSLRTVFSCAESPETIR